MARADLLIRLIKFGVENNKLNFSKVAEAIIAEERAKQHTVLADQLSNIIKAPQRHQVPGGTLNYESFADGLVDEVTPRKALADIVLSKKVETICSDIIQEHHRVDLLKSYNLEPRNRFLFIGPAWAPEN